MTKILKVLKNLCCLAIVVGATEMGFAQTRPTTTPPPTTGTSPSTTPRASSVTTPASSTPKPATTPAPSGTTTAPNSPQKPVVTESSLPSEDIYIDDIVPRRMITENTVLPYESIREADIPYSKRVWRIIDTREKMNLVWRSEENSFFNTIKDLIGNGEITAFNDEFFKEPLTYEEVEKKLFKVETIEGFDFEKNEQTVNVIKNTLDWKNIKKFRIKEIWYFDKNYSILKNRILGISPVLDEYVEAINQTIEQPLFWIYFPEARTHLAKVRVFNDNNDMAPMSWADLIDNRYFSSYIYKKSNVLDYRIVDKYDEKSPTRDFDILLESEKIKQELFNFEHDLWEY
jgi:gliding motility associated protien GldN